MRASTVQWVVATGTSPGGADNLWLWAIDGAHPFVLESDLGCCGNTPD